MVFCGNIYFGPCFSYFHNPANTVERQGAEQLFKDMRGRYLGLVKNMAD